MVPYELFNTTTKQWRALKTSCPNVQRPSANRTYWQYESQPLRLTWFSPWDFISWFLPSPIWTKFLVHVLWMSILCQVCGHDYTQFLGRFVWTLCPLLMSNPNIDPPNHQGTRDQWLPGPWPPKQRGLGLPSRDRNIQQIITGIHRLAGDLHGYLGLLNAGFYIRGMELLSPWNLLKIKHSNGKSLIHDVLINGI